MRKQRPILWLLLSALIVCGSLIVRESLIVRGSVFADEGNGPVRSWSFDNLEGDWTRIENAQLGEGVHKEPLDKALDCHETILTLPADFLPTDWGQISFSAWVFPRRFDRHNEILRKEDGENRLLFAIQEKGNVLSVGANIGGTYLECDGVLPEDGVLNQWHYIVGTVRTADDGRTTTMRVYFDGLLLKEVRARGQLSYGGDAPYFIASYNAECEFFDGLIDDLSIYNRALDEEEILAVKAPDYSSLVKTLVKRASEFEPLTEDQRLHLPNSEQEKWTRFSELKQRIAEKIERGDLDPTEWKDIIATLRAMAPARPSVAEAVAPYQDPYTPPVVDRTAEEAEQLLRSDWLAQCGGNPSKWTILNELRRASELADRIEDSDVDLTEERRQIESLSEEAKKVADSDAELYFKVRHIKRSILFKNPAIDFDTILYIDVPYPQGSENWHETRHRLGYMGGTGGRLMTMKGLSPDGHQKMLLPKEPLTGTFWRPDLSFDADKVLVSFKPHNEKSFHIYEVDINGENVRQLTGGRFDDLDPIYLPDGEHCVFSTTRGYTYVRCMPPTNAFVLARMKLDSSDLYLISRNNEPDYLPSLLPDGRIIFSRWEYTDKPLWRCVSLWTMNPDGTQTQTLWGNQSVWPDLPKDVRAVPDSNRLIITGSAHHNWFSGSVALVDPTKGMNFPDGLTKITGEIPWPETGNGPIDPVESANYEGTGAYSAYDSPYPLTEKDFLVSAQRGGFGGKYVLLLMDTDGNRELIAEGEHNILYAQPVRPRVKPPVIVDRVQWPKKEEYGKAAPGIIYSNNVYDDAPPELVGKAKYLRILNIEPKTYTLWNERPYISTGPAVSMVQSEGVKRILGTVPIEEDGSVSFYAPSGVALHFQLLDENHRCLQTMRSFTGVMPGEQRGCVGCHASQITSPAPQKRSIAVLREPSTITPPPWDDRSVSFERYVQPVLDKHCGSCHSGDGQAKEIFDTTLRPGFLHFKEPYVTIIGNPMWAKEQKIYRPGSLTPWNEPTEPELKDPPPGFGIADTILVEAFSTIDPAGYTTPKPMEKLSYASRLINKYCQPDHYGVRLSETELLRLIVWVDAVCPYMGSDDVRADEDPQFQGSDWLSVKPRLKTAPTVYRPGPFDAFGNDEEIYADPGVVIP